MKRTALITGASAGLGAEFARQLSAQGYDLVLVARRTDKLAQVAADCETHCTLIAADLSRPEAPRMIEQQCEDEGINIDFLVNNAGIAGPDLLSDRDWEAQLDFYRLMMTSVAELCHRFIPAMCDRGYGRVINVASVAGRIARSGGCNYGPSKTYLIALSEELNLTVKNRGVHVTALCPGFTHTDFHATAGMQAQKDAMPKWLWYDASTVVADGIAAVERGRPVAISGRLYRWLDPLLQSVFTRRWFMT
jgi:short-subunit dehydrogenase